MESENKSPIFELIDSLITGFVTPEQAYEIARKYPSTSSSIAGWIHESAARGEWRRVERLANLAAPLAAPGLADVLRKLIDAEVSGLNVEDIVEILGEVRAVHAAASIFRLLERSLNSDAPAYWLSQKIIFALHELDTVEADGYLWSMTRSDWPNPIRWHAAVALGVEEGLGFDEDQMLG